jgi:hypothetical protein
MATNGANPEAISQAEADRREIVEMARNDYRICDGELEIDDNALVSHGDDNGAYVQAWVWVGFAGTKLDKDPSAAKQLA